MIPASELILRPDGSTYHLALRPEHLADTVITVGDPARVARVSQHFDAIEQRVAHREFVSHTGRIGQQRLTVVGTGIGPDNIDIVLNELDALANIDLAKRLPKAERRRLCIVRIGTSGALQPDIAPGAFVASSHGAGLDNLLHFYPALPPLAGGLAAALAAFFEDNNSPVQPYLAAADADLLARFAPHMDASGITLTSPGFYAPQGRELRLPSRLRALVDAVPAFAHGPWRITNMEMETSAIYGLAALLGHQALSCNAILANRPLGQFAEQPAALVDRLIAKVLEILTKD